MRRIPAVFASLLLVLSACRPEYREPDPIPILAPPRPPERILRRPPEFTFTDFGNGNRYFYRTYHDAELQMELITVIRPGAQEEEPATPEEAAHAMKVLEDDWAAKDLQERIDYHRRVLERSRSRRDTLLDSKIAMCRKAVGHLEEERFTIEADITSSKQTPGYQPPAGRMEFLDRKLAEVKLALIEEKARLETYEYARALRDQEYKRSTHAPR